MPGKLGQIPYQNDSSSSIQNRIIVFQNLSHSYPIWLILLKKRDHQNDFLARWPCKMFIKNTKKGLFHVNWGHEARRSTPLMSRNVRVLPVIPIADDFKMRETLSKSKLLRAKISNTIKKMFQKHGLGRRSMCIWKQGILYRLWESSTYSSWWGSHQRPSFNLRDLKKRQFTLHNAFFRPSNLRHGALKKRKV